MLLFLLFIKIIQNFFVFIKEVVIVPRSRSPNSIETEEKIKRRFQGGTCILSYTKLVAYMLSFQMPSMTQLFLQMVQLNPLLIITPTFLESIV